MSQRVVIVVCDSLRRDLITPADAPTLARFAKEACAFEAARGVFPSTTRVSAACLATGCSPAGHGLLGNTVALDEGEGLVCLSVGNPEFRNRLRRATGRTLTAATLAELLRGHDGAVVMSNVSPGAAYFLDPDGHGFVYHRAGSFGPGLAPLGPGEHLDIEIGAAGDDRMTERFCAEIVEDRRPALAVLWLSEPDHSGHAHPLGSPVHRAAIAAADRNVARVHESVERRRRHGEDVLLILCSDHGMETTRRTVPMAALLVEAGLKAAPDSRDVVVAPNGSAAVIYLADDARDRTAAAARFCANQDWCGRVLTGAGLAEIGLPTDGRAAVAVSMAGDDADNGFGVRGRADIVADPASHKDYTGFGQHGGLGPNEQSPFLFVDGGGFARARRTDHPASLIDIAPTVLRHLGRDGAGMAGRPLPFDPPVIAIPSTPQRRVS